MTVSFFKITKILFWLDEWIGNGFHSICRANQNNSCTSTHHQSQLSGILRKFKRFLWICKSNVLQSNLKNFQNRGEIPLRYSTVLSRTMFKSGSYPFKMPAASLPPVNLTLISLSMYRDKSRILSFFFSFKSAKLPAVADGAAPPVLFSVFCYKQKNWLLFVRKYENRVKRE